MTSLDNSNKHQKRINTQFCTISSSNRKRTLPNSWHVYMLSHVWLFASPWTVVRQAPLYMEFSRQEYWSGLPLQRISWPRDRTQDSCATCIGRWILHQWATWEALRDREEKSIAGFKASKDSLILLLGTNAADNFKLLLVLIYHSENPRAL